MEWLVDFRIVYFLGAVNALFFSFLIFSKKQKSLADKILAWWLIVMALQVLYPFLYLTNVTKYQKFIGYEATLSVLHPAGLFFYTKAMVGQLRLNKKLIGIIILLLVCMISVFGFMSYMPDDRIAIFHEQDFLRHFDATGKVLLYFFSSSYFLLCIYFLIRSNYLISSYRKKIRNIYSNSEKIDLRWLRKLVLFFYVAYASTFIAFGVNFMLGISLAYTDYIYYMLTVVFVFLIGYWGHQQGSVFSLRTKLEHTKQEKPENSTGNNGHSYAKEALVLEKVMEVKKPYLEPMLTIHDLADLMKMPSHQLSKVIHKEFGKNFYEYVNHYRILRFKKQVVSEKLQHFTILAVAFDCGFNSKSAFNRIFKEQTGVTPRDYKLQVLSQKKQSA